jgi:hypothetical protein
MNPPCRRPLRPCRRRERLRLRRATNRPLGRCRPRHRPSRVGSHKASRAAPRRSKRKARPELFQRCRVKLRAMRRPSPPPRPIGSALIPRGNGSTTPRTVGSGFPQVPPRRVSTAFRMLISIRRALAGLGTCPLGAGDTIIMGCGSRAPLDGTTSGWRIRTSSSAWADRDTVDDAGRVDEPSTGAKNHRRALVPSRAARESRRIGTPTFGNGTRDSRRAIRVARAIQRRRPDRDACCAIANAR